MRAFRGLGGSRVAIFRSGSSWLSAAVTLGALAACSASPSDEADGDFGSGGGVATGGGTGSGGTGTGGGTASGGAGTGGTTTADCSGLPLCTGFDTDTVGAVPAGFTAKLDYGNNGDPALVAVTSEQAHSGTQAVKVAGTSSGLFGIEYATPGETFYFRGWLKIEAPTSGRPVVVGLGPATGGDLRMRLFNANGSPYYVVANAASGDGLSPPNSSGSATCTDCVALPDDWFCFEMYVDKATQTLQFWVDEAQAVNLTNNAPWHSGTNSWPGTMAPLRLGSMGLEGGGATVYIDDVAIGPARIGCN